MVLEISTCLTIKAFSSTFSGSTGLLLLGYWDCGTVKGDAQSTGTSSSPFAECLPGALYDLLIFPSGNCFFRNVAFGLLMGSISSVS